MPIQNSVKSRSAMLAAFVLYFAVTFATLLLEIPLVRLLERSICTRYYHASLHESTLGNGVDESLCKVAAIQDELATVVGWQMSFNALAGLLTAIYYGRLAERKGRKHVLLLSASGMILMFVWVVAVCQTGAKVEIVWLSSIFLLLGGGLRVFNGMCVAAVSDAVADEERAKYLYLLHAGPHANKALAPMVAAALMTVDLLWPFFCSFAVFGAALLIIGLFYSDMASESIPKTKHDYSAIPQNSLGDQHERLLASPTAHDTPHDTPHASNPLNEQQPIPTCDDNKSTQVAPWYLSVVNDLKRLFSPHLAIFCLVAFLFKRIAFASESFVFQYTSEQFGWRLRDTTWLRLTHGVGAVLTTLVICPLLTIEWKRRSLSTHLLDLCILRVCLVVLCLSFMTAFETQTAGWLFPALLGMGLGEGLEPALQGLVTYVNDPADYSQLFGIIAMVDHLAELVGGPLSASLIAVGRSKHSASSGFNFLSSAMMFGCLALWAFVLRVQEHDMMQRFW